MFNNTTLIGDDVDQTVTIDSALLEQIDERIGNTTMTRRAFVQSALQQYITTMDKLASQQTIQLPDVKPSYS